MLESWRGFGLEWGETISKSHSVLCEYYFCLRITGCSLYVWPSVHLAYCCNHWLTPALLNCQQEYIYLPYLKLGLLHEKHGVYQKRTSAFAPHYIMTPHNIMTSPCICSLASCRVHKYALANSAQSDSCRKYMSPPALGAHILSAISRGRQSNQMWRANVLFAAGKVVLPNWLWKAHASTNCRDPCTLRNPSSWAGESGQLQRVHSYALDFPKWGSCWSMRASSCPGSVLTLLHMAQATWTLCHWAPSLSHGPFLYKV